LLGQHELRSQQRQEAEHETSVSDRFLLHTIFSGLRNQRKTQVGKSSFCAFAPLRETEIDTGTLPATKPGKVPAKAQRRKGIARKNSN
jgi:hypothetical protein